MSKFAEGQWWALRNGAKVKIVSTSLGVKGFQLYPIGGIVYEDNSSYLEAFTADGAYQDVQTPTGLDITHQLSETHEKL